MIVKDLFPDWPKEGEPFTEDQGKFIWLGAQVEREGCLSVLNDWAKRHGVSGSAFDELQRLIGSAKDPYAPFITPKT